MLGLFTEIATDFLDDYLGGLFCGFIVLVGLFIGLPIALGALLLTYLALDAIGIIWLISSIHAAAWPYIATAGDWLFTGVGYAVVYGILAAMVLITVGTIRDHAGLSRKQNVSRFFKWIDDLYFEIEQGGAI